MTIVESIVYGIVQGLTEFLPISSTAHLRLVPALVGWHDPGSAFTAVIQLGTVGAVLIYFWRDLSAAFMGWIKSFKGDKDTVEARTGWAVFWATVLIAVLGLAGEKLIVDGFRNLYVIAGSLIFMGVLMLIADQPNRRARSLDSVQVADGIKIGLWQCMALIPGMSRSGSSITGALFGGFDRPAAARLSFLMSVPAVTLAGLYQGAKNFKLLEGDLKTPTFVATVVSFIVGYACINWLITFISKKGTKPFVAYRIALGLVVISLCALHKIDPVDHSKESDVSPKVTATQ